MERKGPGPTDPLVRAEPPFDWYRTPTEVPRRVETPERTPITLDPDIALWPVTPLSRWPFIGPPTEGMWPVGWMGVDATGTIYTCTVGGEPGTWAAQGGSSGQNPHLKFPFAWNTAGISTGAPLYVPTPEDILYDAWVEVTASFGDADTNPRGDIGLFTTGGTGLFAAINNAVMYLVHADSSAGLGVLTNPFNGNTTTQNVRSLANVNADVTKTRIVPAKFVTAAPVCIKVLSTAAVAATVDSFSPPLVPFTIDGTNNEFVFTGDGGARSPEAFTLAPGPVTTEAEAIAAMAAAIGSMSGERFDTIVTPADDGAGNIMVTMVGDAGRADNGNTITPGVNDALVNLGFNGPPYTFAGGLGGPPITAGTGILHLIVYSG